MEGNRRVLGSISPTLLPERLNRFNCCPACDERPVDCPCSSDGSTLFFGRIRPSWWPFAVKALVSFFFAIALLHENLNKGLDFIYEETGIALFTLLLFGYGAYSTSRAFTWFQARPLAACGIEFTGSSCCIWDPLKGRISYDLKQLEYLNVRPRLSHGSVGQVICVSLPCSSSPDTPSEFSFIGDFDESYEILEELCQRIDCSVNKQERSRMQQKSGRNLSEWVRLARDLKVDTVERHLSGFTGYELVEIARILRDKYELTFAQAVVVARRAMRR